MLLEHCVNTNLYQRCVHVWLNNEVEIFVSKTSIFLILQPVKIGRIHVVVVVMNVSFCDCAAQLSSYTTVLDRYKIVQSSKYFIDIHQTCRYGQRYINIHQKRNKDKIKYNVTLYHKLICKISWTIFFRKCFFFSFHEWVIRGNKGKFHFLVSRLVSFAQKVTSVYPFYTTALIAALSSVKLKANQIIDYTAFIHSAYTTRMLQPI